MSERTRPLRAADLVPGRMYFSPSGQLCVLRPPAARGIGTTAYLFSYVSRPSDEFFISEHNVRAIAAMREAPIVQPEFAARFGRAA